jgi:hypothetical protein
MEIDILKELSLRPQRCDYWLKLWNEKGGENYLIIPRTMNLEALDGNCKK